MPAPIDAEVAVQFHSLDFVQPANLVKRCPTDAQSYPKMKSSENGGTTVMGLILKQSSVKFIYSSLWVLGKILDLLSQACP